jgi:hypothetical protein
VLAFYTESFLPSKRPRSDQDEVIKLEDSEDDNSTFGYANETHHENKSDFET